MKEERLVLNLVMQNFSLLIIPEKEIQITGAEMIFIPVLFVEKKFPHLKVFTKLKNVVLKNAPLK